MLAASTVPFFLLIFGVPLVSRGPRLGLQSLSPHSSIPCTEGMGEETGPALAWGPRSGQTPLPRGTNAQSGIGGHGTRQKTGWEGRRLDRDSELWALAV